MIKQPENKEYGYHGGVKEIYYIPALDIDYWGFDKEEITEDAEFEIIEPKQLPPIEQKSNI